MPGQIQLTIEEQAIVFRDQQSWARRQRGETLDTPPCYNRPDNEPIWKPGCSHWFKPMGTAYTFKANRIDGVNYTWLSCHGCRQKTLVLG